jgi:hypothetical protein
MREEIGQEAAGSSSSSGGIAWPPPRYHVGAKDGFIILEDTEGKQARFREREIRDVVDGLEKLGQLSPPRFSYDGARARLRELRPEFDVATIEAIIFAVLAGGASEEVCALLNTSACSISRDIA